MSAWIGHAAAVALIVSVLGFTASGAVAERPADAENSADVGDEVGGDPEVEPLTLSRGAIRIHGVVELNLSANLVAEPVSLAPDVSYGVSDELTVGLVHSTVGSTGFWGGVGRGICVTGEGDEQTGCAVVYNNVGASGQYSLLEGGLDLAADGGLFVTAPFDDETRHTHLKVGVLARWAADELQVVVRPNLFIGLTGRGVASDGLFIPGSVLYRFSPEVVLMAQTGFEANLDELGDSWGIPVSVGGAYRLGESLRVGGMLSLQRVIGARSSADLRALNAFISYEL